MKQNEIKTGFDGLPPIKDQYEPEEKKLIAQAADKYGTRPVAEAYGMKWQAIVAWKKYYGTQSQLKNPQKSEVKIVIQSSTMQEITVDEILAKVGEVDAVYIRADENAAYWVKGEEHGSVNLW